jgi:hypothetical protein
MKPGVPSLCSSLLFWRKGESLSIHVNICIEPESCYFLQGEHTNERKPKSLPVNPCSQSLGDLGNVPLSWLLLVSKSKLSPAKDILNNRPI